MQVRDAFIRSARTGAAVLVAVVAVVAPIVNALPDGTRIGKVDVKEVTSGAVAVVTAVASALVTFAVNLAEDNTAFQLPK